MSMNFLTACVTDIGLRRSLNEDGYLDRPDAGLWVVADGMGGHDAGEVASGLIVSSLEALPASGELEQMTANVLDCVRSVHGQLIDLAGNGLKPRTIGSTVVGLVIARGEYRCFWVGDSRAYLVRNRAITQLTHDHSLVQSLIDAKLLDPADAEKHPDANVITRAIGADKPLEIDVRTGQAQTGDLFLLVSDGVSRVLTSEEILADLIERNPRQALQSMSEKILARGAPDNFTAVVIRIL